GPEETPPPADAGRASPGGDPAASGGGVPGDQVLEDARAKLAAALQAFTAAQSALAAVQSALAAGRALPRGNLMELDKVRSALAEAAEALGLDPERATLAELEARLATRERTIGLRRALEYLGQATGPPVAAAQLAPLAADAARLATSESC